MKIPAAAFQKRVALVAGLDLDRYDWWQLWRDLADYVLPKRYEWLLSKAERRRRLARNPNILDGTGTQAARTCASGMMNGITSPSREWFKLRIAGFDLDEDQEAAVWLDEVQRRMLLIMAESNFYEAMATMYLDLVVFGTNATLIYEDFDDVIRCYSCPIGSFYFALDDRLAVSTFARRFEQTVAQIVQWFGKENCSDRVKTAYQDGGARLNETIIVRHLIEPVRAGDDIPVASNMKYREIYWEDAPQVPGDVLEVSGFNEPPGIFPRWEITGNDAYGTSPGMDALGDIIQLQHETKRKAQVLDYSVRPPTMSDITLQGRPTAFLPGSNTFVANLATNAGVKPIWQANPNIQEITADIRDVQVRINEIFFNDLFKMISQLDTVRSATEIDARREEKLILLGPVLERLGNELDKAINRIYGIADRARLFPKPPNSIRGRQIEIQYISILSTAQTAAGAVPAERFLQLVGNLAAIYRPVLDIPNFDQLVRNYGRAIGIKANEVNSQDQVLQMRQNQAQQAQAAQAADFAQKAAMAGKTLSQTDVGGGVNALQALSG